MIRSPRGINVGRCPVAAGSGNNKSSSRIPESLKAIFLASNGGEDVKMIQPPPVTVASNVFPRNAKNLEDGNRRTNIGMTSAEAAQRESELKAERMIQRLLDMHSNCSTPWEQESEENPKLSTSSTTRVVSFASFEVRGATANHFLLDTFALRGLNV